MTRRDWPDDDGESWRWPWLVIGIPYFATAAFLVAVIIVKALT